MFDFTKEQIAAFFTTLSANKAVPYRNTPQVVAVGYTVGYCAIRHAAFMCDIDTNLIRCMMQVVPLHSRVCTLPCLLHVRTEQSLTGSSSQQEDLLLKLGNPTLQRQVPELFQTIFETATLLTEVDHEE
mgnify:FL=1